MKKIHLVSKTHLDLGFTDYAENVVNRYREEFIPNAVALAERLNKNEKKFVWTTGSWLIKDSLENASEINKKKLDGAIKKGWIVWHGLPFTTHSELLDSDTFNYGLSISKNLDKKYNKKTISAKMTDVPGHTKAIIPLLFNAGIRLLHIGVNEASAMPDVPQCFLWKNGDSEIIVIYEGSYGSLYKNPFIDDILCFIHSNDNHGPSSENQINNMYIKLKKQYPDYEITASTLEDYASELLKVKDKLPVVTSEIGDTWIHGVASDPYKTGALRELINLKKKWIFDGRLKKDSFEYNNFSDNLLQIAEHTWGMDSKRYLSDYNYLKEDFRKARKNNIADIKRMRLNLYHKLLILINRKSVAYKQGSYEAVEKSWKEQRNYICKALDCLPMPLRNEGANAVAKLLPDSKFDRTDFIRAELNKEYSVNGYSVIFDGSGLKTLKYKSTVIMDRNSDLGTVNYYSYGCKDYDFWKTHYTRNYKKTKNWSEPDFLRPGLKYADKKYSQGVFPYTLSDLYISEDSKTFILKMIIDTKLSDENGAPSLIEIKYNFDGNKIVIETIWLNKDASRLPEAVFINFPVNADKDSLEYVKMGNKINPYDIAKNGNRNLSSVEEIDFKNTDKPFRIINIHSPLVSVGGGKI